MFCNRYTSYIQVFGEATVWENFVSFYFCKYSILFLGFAFLFSLLSLLSLFFLSLSRLPNTPLEDDNSRDAWLSLLPLKRKEASLAVGLKHVVLLY